MARKIKKVTIENQRTVLQPVSFSDAGEKSQAILLPDIDNINELASYKALRGKRFKRAILRTVLWFFIILLLPVMIFFTVIICSPNSAHNFFGYTFYIVSSNSMVPDFDENDMIVVKTNFSIDEIKIGTDITFLRADDGQIVTHRVKSFEDTESGRVYTTRGINNSFDDSPVNFNDIQGIKINSSRPIGNIIVFLRSGIGLVVLFLFFGLIIAGLYISFAYSNDIRAVGK